MGVPAWYHDGFRCCICGAELKPYGDTDTESFSVDHIVPKSLGKDVVPERMQATCKRCNQLKSNHYPSALLYRVIAAFRYLEEKHSELYVKSIALKELNSIDRIYKVQTKCGMSFEVPSSGEPMRCKIDLMEHLDIVIECSKDIQKLSDYILCGIVGIVDKRQP